MGEKERESGNVWERRKKVLHMHPIHHHLLSCIHYTVSTTIKGHSLTTLGLESFDLMKQFLLTKLIFRIKTPVLI